MTHAIIIGRLEPLYEFHDRDNQPEVLEYYKTSAPLESYYSSLFERYCEENDLIVLDEYVWKEHWEDQPREVYYGRDALDGSVDFVVSYNDSTTQPDEAITRAFENRR